jgi:hypothetical protein
LRIIVLDPYYAICAPVDDSEERKKNVELFGDACDSFCNDPQKKKDGFYMRDAAIASVAA